MLEGQAGGPLVAAVDDQRGDLQQLAVSPRASTTVRMSPSDLFGRTDGVTGPRRGDGTAGRIGQGRRAAIGAVMAAACATTLICG